VLTDLTGLTFAEAWSGRVRHPFDDVDVDFIGLDAFVARNRTSERSRRYRGDVLMVKSLVVRA
jgi:hypothetical protein